MSISGIEASTTPDDLTLFKETTEETEKVATPSQETTVTLSKESVQMLAQMIYDIGKQEAAKQRAPKEAAKKQAAKPVAPAKPAVTPLNLKKISKKALDKMDHDLVKKHIKRGENIQWDRKRGIVVLEKSGKTRAYKIGNGAGPALAESSSRTAVLDHIKNVKA